MSLEEYKSDWQIALEIEEQKGRLRYWKGDHIPYYKASCSKCGQIVTRCTPNPKLKKKFVCWDCKYVRQKRNNKERYQEKKSTSN